MSSTAIKSLRGYMSALPLISALLSFVMLLRMPTHVPFMGETSLRHGRAWVKGRVCGGVQQTICEHHMAHGPRQRHPTPLLLLLTDVPEACALPQACDSVPLCWRRVYAFHMSTLHALARGQARGAG